MKFKLKLRLINYNRTWNCPAFEDLSYTISTSQHLCHKCLKTLFPVIFYISNYCEPCLDPESTDIWDDWSPQTLRLHLLACAFCLFLLDLANCSIQTPFLCYLGSLHCALFVSLGPLQRCCSIHSLHSRPAATGSQPWAWLEGELSRPPEWASRTPAEASRPCSVSRTLFITSFIRTAWIWVFSDGFNGATEWE